jgi:hypothetical protein
MQSSIEMSRVSMLTKNSLVGFAAALPIAAGSLGI